ncbi:LOW QUALITY PROTEIN: E3 ubiquitin-protein ligase RNF123-like [Liolophura sinensis]|uniref:LOW QUALITY PROTEIN: E3 ubiquitin-protein ligase RNF123-like n=1 Tax=Liolophura sinensis TaxID=3198878 RepID=UPI0031580570
MADRRQGDISGFSPQSRSPGRRCPSASSRVSANSLESDPHTYHLLRQVFTDQTLSSEAGSGGLEKALGLHNLDDHIDKELHSSLAACGIVKDESSTVTGRIGPAVVVFDTSSSVGRVLEEPDRLSISSHSNFSTTRANCCVYKGKWLYEVMLGSKGVMQLGWCTLQCKFSQEEGVGDTVDSYAYDGSRLRKWNVRTRKYGESWLCGDVISCAIDCDNGKITFYRNGHSLGVAFENVKTGRGYAYFPAVSLSQQESVRANFGATPIRYPVDGYLPLQIPPQVDLIKANLLIKYLDNLLPILAEAEKCDEARLLAGKYNGVPLPQEETRSRQSTCLLVAAHIFERFAPLLKSPYIMEASLLKFLLKLNEAENATDQSGHSQVFRLLDLMWTFMQDSELKGCLENLAISLLSAYRFAPVTTDFKLQKTYLLLALTLLRHQTTRRYLLTNVLFNKIRFPVFLYVKPLDEAGLIEAIPTVDWNHQKVLGVETTTDSTRHGDDTGKNSEYLDACDRLRQKIEEIEDIQVEMLKTLLIHSDVKEGTTTRMIFLSKFRLYLKENTGSSHLPPVNACPLSVSLCFFHRLVRAIRFYWDEFVLEDPKVFVYSKDAFLPMQYFFQDSIDYFDFQRCGGLMSHLNKTLGSKVNLSQGLTVLDSGQVVQCKSGKPTASLPASSATNKHTGAEGGSLATSYPDLEMPSGNSLMELLDGLIILYHIAAHKQLSKTCTFRDSLKEYVTSLEETTKKLKLCPADEKFSEIRSELERARSVFTERLSELTRQMSWFIAVTYSKNKQTDIRWVFQVVLQTIEKATTYVDLFQFMPEFYIDVCINTYNALRHYFHPTVAFEKLEGHLDLLRRYGMFLVNHFADARIVNADVRDNIVQALACFTCYPQSLQTLENLPYEKRRSLITCLVAPYENRSWAQTNWILVRIWKGNGFGFRYTHLPHLVPSKQQPTEFGSASLQKPCPSRIFQELLASVLIQNPETATKFLDTVLNQLNWSFSEFIGMMQEIQQVVSRPEIRILDTRQIKICATCFEISVSLMRVVEMVANVAPQLFTDWKFSSAELLLGRLLQLLCQVLNRVTSRGGMFENVVSLLLPGLESVTHLPIVAAAVGILIQLVLKSSGKGQERVTHCLCTEAGFQLSSLEFLLGGTGQETTNTDKKVFTFRSYKEVDTSEVEMVESLITHIRKYQNTASEQAQPVREEDLCTICYANPQTAVFQPCGHRSCRKCIRQHLMSKKECFFCKLIITGVLDVHGLPIQ